MIVLFGSAVAGGYGTIRDMRKTSTSVSTYTFSGDREALQTWLSEHSDFRVSDDLTFRDGSVLLFLDAAPYAVQGWCGAAVGQTLDLGSFPAGQSGTDSAAESLARLLNRGSMLDATLRDAETAKEMRDPRTRGRLLNDAMGVAEEHHQAVRAFESAVAYDTRVGAVFHLPDRETLLTRVPVRGPGLESVREAVAGVAWLTMDGTAFADVLVEAARTTLPVVTGDGAEAWDERRAVGRELRRDVLPSVVRSVLADAPEGVVNEALRHVAGSRRLE